MTQTVPRRTIYLPDSVEEMVREHALPGESFSAAAVRLIELGAPTDEGAGPGYIGSGEGGPPDLGINAEKYLGLEPWDPGEGPGDQGPR